jgi:hypothetical protein
MPAGSTYFPIATTTLGTAAASVTFSSISGSYTDLILITTGTAAATNPVNGLKLQFNGDTGSNYSTTFMYGTGSSAESGRSSSAAFISIARADTTQSNGITHIQNYSNSTTNKTVLSRGNVASAGQFPLAIAYVGLWRNTAAITSMTISHENSVNFNAGFIFTLYGISAA